MVELISLHVPKCAGTAFRVALERAYGPAALHMDYSASPANPCAQSNIDPEGYEKDCVQIPGRLAPETRVVHGHFRIDKYHHVGACPRITLLRHPVDRAISHYYFWKNGGGGQNPLAHYVRSHSLSLLQFVRLPTIRYFYSGVFFRSVTRSMFDFVGCYERIGDDLERLARLLGRPFTLPRANEGVRDSERSRADTQGVRDALTSALAEDIAFYENWCH